MGQQYEDYLTSSFGGYPYGAGANNPPQKLVPRVPGKVNPIGLGGIRRPQDDYERIEYPLHGVGGQ